MARAGRALTRWSCLPVAMWPPALLRGCGRSESFGASLDYPMLPLALYWLANLVFYGFGEEIGWRGLAQPTLQRRHSALTAAVLVSLVWAGWHLPLFGISATYRSMPAIGFLGFYFSLLTASFVLAWLYLRSQGSILVVAVFHATFDIATTTPTQRPSSRF